MATFPWRDEYWKLFGSFGRLWLTNEMLQNQVDKLLPYVTRLERKNTRLEEDNSRLLTDNNRLRNDNLRLRGAVEVVADNLDQEVAQKIETAFLKAQAA